MSDVVLFFPSTGLDIKGVSIVLPLSVLCVSAPLVKKGYSVKIIDQRIDKNWQQTLVQELKTKTIAVGISAMTGKQIRGGVEASKFVKLIAPDVTVVWGGIHASLLPRQTLKNSNIDIVVAAEEEATFLDLVERIRTRRDISQVKGIYYKNSRGNISYTGKRAFLNLDDLPQLPYELVDLNVYSTSFLMGKKEISHFATRGCPYECAFCYNAKFNNRKWRSKSPENIVRELKKIKSLGIEVVSFADEEFFIDISKIRQICALLKKEKLGLKFMASCRINDLLKFDNKLLSELCEIGFISFYVGVESGSNRILQYIKKHISKEQVLQANQKIKHFPIDVYYSFMCGFVHETEKDILETIDLMLTLYYENPRAFILPIKVFTPYPGTELFEQCIERGFSVPKQLVGWIDFKWHVSQATWLDKKTKKFINVITYLTIFMDEKHCLKSKVGKKIPLISLIAILYAHLMRFRLHHGLYFFNPDIILFKAIKSIFLVSKNIVSGITLAIRKLIKGKNEEIEMREDIMGKQNTVVLIGADEKTVEIIREALPDWEASKVPVSKIKEKVSVLADQNPSVIMLKACPEKEKTLELCNQINTAPLVTDIPLLVEVDRRSQVTQVQYILEAGADKCIVSPLEKEDLKTKIEELVA